MKDYYKILELNSDASFYQIKSAFRRLSFKYHPDLNNEPDSEDNFKLVNEAYQILTDPLLKNIYDEKLKNQNTTFSYQGPVLKPEVYKKRNNSIRNISLVFLLFLGVFLIFQAASSLSSVNTINGYKSNLSKKANEFYLHSQQRDKQIDIIIRRTNSLVDMFRNIPK